MTVSHNSVRNTQERDTRWRKQGDRARVHFFNSFFVGKLIKCAHLEPH